MDKVSIIVPIYNSEKYLKECIESILSQKYEKFELILVNDGSTDNSLSICNKYSNIDKRVRIINLEHKGVCNARNAGILSATGKYICFVDSDDKIDSNFLQTLIFLKDKYNADIVEVDFKYLNDKKKSQRVREEQVYTPKQMIHRLYSKNGVRTVIIPNKLYKIELFKNIKFEEHQNEDEFIIHKLFFATKNKIVVSNEKLYYYRIHSRSRQRTFCKEKLELLDVFSEREKYFKFDEELLKKNKIAKIDMILFLYYICRSNGKKQEQKYLTEIFSDEYANINFKLNTKRKVKYKLFDKLPNLVSYFISLKRGNVA